MSLSKGWPKASRWRRCSAIASSGPSGRAGSAWPNTCCRSGGWSRCGRTASAAAAPARPDQVAARDVVDGVGLLERWRTEGAALFDALRGVRGLPLAPAEVFVMPPSRSANTWPSNSIGSPTATTR